MPLLVKSCVDHAADSQREDSNKHKSTTSNYAEAQSISLTRFNCTAGMPVLGGNLHVHQRPRAPPQRVLCIATCSPTLPAGRVVRVLIPGHGKIRQQHQEHAKTTQGHTCAARTSRHWLHHWLSGCPHCHTLINATGPNDYCPQQESTYNRVRHDEHDSILMPGRTMSSGGLLA